jgi:GH25 family lysozyme M1 (1,4-beta-N-acetylmuramidase)
MAHLSPVRIRPTSARLPRRLMPAVPIAGAVLIALTSPVLTGTATAAAAPSGTLHQDADHAGSTVRAHEGGQTGTITPQAVTGPKGMDVSSWQGNVNWSAAWSNGARFAYVKATEGTSYRNPYFAQQYDGSYGVGMIRGAYHFALPNASGGAAQADHFVDHGGGWTADGRTLPPALDVEYNPYGGGTCYGLSPAAMVSWIAAFSGQVRARTGRYPTIYTTTDWWRTCTGNSGAFASTNPLWIARYASTVGALPAGWTVHTFWQYSASPLDQNTFNGGYDRLQALARG